MSLFNWMKKAVKVVDKMATEAAEKPDIEKPRKTMSTVPNPDNNSYLERWNNRKPPEFIELEMPELAFQSRFDFSKVRGFDFGMENNQISIFIDGKNQMIAREDISSMNVFLNQGHMDDSDVPLFKILEESIRFEPSLSGMDDYTNRKETEISVGDESLSALTRRALEDIAEYWQGNIWRYLVFKRWKNRKSKDNLLELCRKKQPVLYFSNPPR